MQLVMDDDLQKITPIIQIAIEEIKTHQAVKHMSNISVIDNIVFIKTEWAVTLPNTALKKGISATGVKKIEDVYWQIPLDYPQRAPSPRLRKDFPTNLPHINPYTPGNLVYPCITEVPIEDLLHSRGLQAILNAMTQWLDNAAVGELHCPIQGWEYVRRDNTTGMVVVDVHCIREELHDNNNTVRFYNFRYSYWKNSNEFLLGNLQTPHLGSANTSYKKSYVGISVKSDVRQSPGILFQTHKDKIVGEYRPEMVTDMKTLREFANYLGLGEAFDARIKYIVSILAPQSVRKGEKIPVEEFMVTFAVKRPFNLIGSHSSWELLPYLVSYTPETNNLLTSNTVVRPTHFIERCCSKLLQAASAENVVTPIKIASLGCGSLGSKITLHLAKTGCYEFELIDKDVFSSHNNARHGLIVGDFDSLIASKSHLLSREISRLNISSKPIFKDIREIGKTNGFSLSVKTDYVIDSTASLPIRHFLSHNCKKIQGQLIHCVLYGKSTMGVVAIEGLERSVRIDDLMAFANTTCIENNLIQTAMYGTPGPERNYYGEGCGSVTTTMNDIDISLMSTAITSKISSHITQEKKSTTGFLHVGTINKKSLNMQWEAFQFPSTFVIPRDNTFVWDVRVLGSVSHEIEQLSNKDTTVENGGIIAGQICFLTNTIYVTYLLDAPEDSIRSVSKFELSTKGLPEKFEEIHKKTNGQVTFLGTWHSHTQATPPSLKDKESLKQLQVNYDLPIVMLTYTGGRIVRV